MSSAASRPARAALVALLLSVTASHAAGAAADHPADDTLASVQHRVQAFVEQATLPLADPGVVAQVTVGEPRRAALSPCDDPQPFLPSGARLRSSVSIGVRCLSPSRWTIYIPVTIALQVDYVVAAHALRAGHLITATDLVQRQAAFDRLPNGAARTTEALVGQIVATRVSAGQTIRTDALRAPDAIVRGQQVRLTASGRGFTITSEGTALATAAPGSTVQVRTPSGQIVSGIVRGPSSVDVMM